MTIEQLYKIIMEQQAEIDLLRSQINLIGTTLANSDKEFQELIDALTESVDGLFEHTLYK